MEVPNILKKLIQKDQKGKEKCCAACASDNRRTERKTRKCFRFGYDDHIITKCPKPLKENEKQQKQVRLNEKGNRACENSENRNDQKIN